MPSQMSKCRDEIELKICHVGPQPSTAGGGNAHSCLLPTANKTQEEEAGKTYFESKRTVLRYIQT